MPPALVVSENEPRNQRVSEIELNTKEWFSLVEVILLNLL